MKPFILGMVLLFSWAGCSKDSNGYLLRDADSESVDDDTLSVRCLFNGTLIDGTGSEPVADAVVLICGDSILAAGPKNQIGIPDYADRIDLQGGFILPGFINTHVHNAIQERNLRTWAREGVTTVRDVGAAESSQDVFAFRDRVRSDSSCARLIAAGPLVTVPGGYPIVPNHFPALAVTSVEDARLQIRRLLAEGANCIKVTLSPGSGNPTLSTEEARAIVEEAHAGGVPVTAHITRTVGFQMALDVGVDDAAHSDAEPLPDELIRRMIDQGMFLVPTLTAQGNRDVHRENLMRFIRAGGSVALGNDGGYLSGLEIGMPISEIEVMADAGMTPMQIITASTQTAARVCRLDDRLGTIESGKQADLLVLTGNPFENLRELLNVAWVIHDGKIIRQPS